MAPTAVIADDEDLPRAELRRMLGSAWPELQVVAECEHGPAAVEAIDQHAPDVAFLDIRPFTPGHLLVVPRSHAPHLAYLDPADAAHMMTVAQRLAQALRDSDLPADGITLFLSDGAVAGQDVVHAHLHVLPRTADDGFRVAAQPQSPTREALDGQAAAIRQALAPA